MAKLNTSRLETYDCGARVFPKQMKNVEGMITCISNRFGKISYEVTYFIGYEERSVWMHEKQFTTKSKKKPIGFK